MVQTLTDCIKPSWTVKEKTTRQNFNSIRFGFPKHLYSWKSLRVSLKGVTEGYRLRVLLLIFNLTSKNLFKIDRYTLNLRMRYMFEMNCYCLVLFLDILSSNNLLTEKLSTANRRMSESLVTSKSLWFLESIWTLCLERNTVLLLKIMMVLEKVTLTAKSDFFRKKLLPEK